MKKARISIIIALFLVGVVASKVLGQGSAYGTSMTSSIAFQNVGTLTANINVRFAAQGGATPVATGIFSLNPNAGASLSASKYPNNNSTYIGSSLMSSNQPLTAVLVQIPQSSAVKTYPVSSLFRVGSSRVLLATVLKNKFNTNTLFAIQNVSGVNVDFVVKIFNADNPSADPYTKTRNDVPPGASYIFDMGNSQSVTGLPDIFNGSVIAEGYKSDAGHTHTIPATIVGSALEMMTSGYYGARAYEGVARGATKLFMATALCDAFGGIRTAYAVQNVSDSGNASVFIEYYNTDGSLAGVSSTQLIAHGAKYSFQTCTDRVAGFSGSAVIKSTGGEIIAVGKATKNSNPSNPNYGTAFIGVSYGSSKLSLPYVRWTSDTNYNYNGKQRVYLAIQNVGPSAITNVQVKYIDTYGNVVGTHTISSIAAYAKQNSNASLAFPLPNQEFGYPEANGNGLYGGAVIIEGAGEMIAIGRVQSMVDLFTNKDVAEDYNAFPLP